MANNLHIFLKVVNVLTYLFFLSATIYSTVGPEPIDTTDLNHYSYLSPSPCIQWVWTLVHFLLGGFVIYQWFEPAHEGAIRGVGWHFVIPTLLNSVWLALWNKNHLFLAWIAILFTASSVSFVFYNLEKNHPSQNIFDKLFIHAPFSLWHGWIVFIAVITTFATLTKVETDMNDVVLPPSVTQIIFAELGLLFLSSTAVTYTEFKHKRGDVLGAAVIALGLYAIFMEQKDPIIHWSALGFAIFTTLYPARPYIARLFGFGVSEETAPLLG